MTGIIDGVSFQRMIVHAAAAINAQKQQINELNVFPVPDGDTGTNMSLTIGTAAGELKKKAPETVGKAASINASALLRGARGNSGVILSLLFRGVARALKDRATITGVELAAALNEGVSAAYGAVMKPAEGTILTVSRLSAVRASAAAEENADPIYVLEETIKEGQVALADTVNQNPVLKKAGVVDAGGKGYLIILQGMVDALKGLPMPEAEEASAPVQDKADFAHLSDEEITFTFDTVFIVRKTSDRPLAQFRDYLNSIGDSLVIGEDDEAFKVHVHTDIPGEALTEAQKYGTLELAKIENMRTQYEDMAAGRTPQSTDGLDRVEQELEASAAKHEEEERWIAAPEKKFGYVSVCAGEGLANLFRDLGADGIISGGQTMNPSTADILREIDHTPAEIVYVLPNNKNIIMAAEQCVKLSKEKKVIVLPTATVPQGVTAMLDADPDAGEEANTGAMRAAIERVRTAQITYAARDSDFDGFDIHEGDYLALQDNKLFGTNQDLTGLLDELARGEAQQNAEFITLFYGEDVTEEQAQQAQALFAAACPNAEISLIAGGQPVYYYLISAE
ncbi:MAG: DAK2 domain-containing protein [Oscillospiraceae bacterium]|nr:DAK2 domain-containing protein [Oscillospiraceae bacterium]